MSKDEFNVIESILFSFPELCRSADIRREYILSLACTKDPGEHVQGGSGLCTADCYADGNRHLEAMETIIKQTSASLTRLRAEEKEFISQYYFNHEEAYNFDDSLATLYRKRKKLCQKVMSLIRVYPLFREWREREKEERLEAAKRGIKN
ncbi:hypothetical protein [Cloacibacillus evryensis]|uniref:hypothetical protein n=1 Tax=Cloacibacillus evryensis TaxID=508460 RepID=UPI002B2061C9|nr:hypothetical protein [Cloacibacillus evryensis]MEA5034197.1 hypothetical protein [Cloacibacillus evryensis]